MYREVATNIQHRVASLMKILALALEYDLKKLRNNKRINLGCVFESTGMITFFKYIQVRQINQINRNVTNNRRTLILKK